MNKDIEKAILKLKEAETKLSQVRDRKKDCETMLSNIRKELRKFEGIRSDLYDEEDKYKREWQEVRDKFVDLALKDK